MTTQRSKISKESAQDQFRLDNPNLMKNLNTSSYDQDETFNENSIQVITHNSEEAIRERKRTLIERSNQNYIMN
jgi:hypothetical protein